MGMSYLSGNWATDHRATAVAGRLGDRRLISSMFDFLPLTGRQATAVAWQPVSVVVNHLVGMGLKQYIFLPRMDQFIICNILY